MRWLRNVGPGLLVTAAFIGPGTLTTASAGGARFGYSLAWAVAFSVVATIVLQEMSARLGLVTRHGLGESIRTAFVRPWARGLAVALVLSAIGLGNAAYQTGNILGAAGGLEALTGIGPPVWIIAISFGAALLLLRGVFKLIERVLMLLVVLMSTVFIVTAVIARPDFGALASGFVPRVPRGSLFTIIAMVGTTVVPYNLFLHASAVQEKWSASVPVDRAIRAARRDSAVSIGIGGLITLAVLVTAVSAFFVHGSQFDGLAEMARSLEPLLGSSAKYFFAVGLVAAGLTSAITAPVAVAYAASGVLGWRMELRDPRFRATWAAILLVGTTCALTLGTSPVATIVFAQATNGILLPIIAVFLLTVMNRKQLLGRYTNSLFANLCGGFVVIVAAGLGIVQLLRAIQIIG